MQMTESEIVKSYHEAKRKREQVKILADLNNCSKEEITAILFKNGIDQRELGEIGKNATEKGIDTRKRIKDFVIRYMGEHGYSPTVREIGDAIGLKSSSSVQSHLVRMFKDGDLETDKEFGSARAIRVPGYAFVKLEEVEKCSKPLPTKNGYVQMVYRD